jgi:hypothetical protein
VSEHHVPAGKLCPFISTAQVLVSELAFQSQGQTQKGMSLQGIQGVPGAGTPDTVVSQGKAAVIHRDPVLPADHDPSKPIDISQIKTFRAQPVSVPCVREKCQGWDDVAQDCGYKSKSASPAEALAAAQGLLNRAHQNVEQPQENPA